MLKQLNRWLLILGGLTVLPACSNNEVTWQEEVKLNDGRMIVVTQKKLMDRGIDREAWLTFSLPEFSKTQILWHESQQPIVLNVHKGKLYVVGLPPTQREFFKYGKPRPPYVPYRWENGAWQRIPFAELPEAIYDVNMLIDGMPPKGTKLLTWNQKMSPDLNGKGTYTTDQKRLDPNDFSPSDHEASKLELQRWERARVERERLKQEKQQRDSGDRNSDHSDKP